MDLTLRKIVYKGPVVGGSIVIRNGRRPVLLKPEHEGRMEDAWGVPSVVPK